MLTKKSFFTVAGLSVILALVLFQKEGAFQPSQIKPREALLQTEQTKEETKMVSSETVNNFEKENPELVSDAEETRIPSAIPPSEDHHAKHEFGIDHDCFESLNLGSKGLLPKVELSEDEIANMKVIEKEMEEKMLAEFEDFIVSDDGQTVYDKKAITEDFIKEVKRSERAEEGEVMAASFEEI